MGVKTVAISELLAKKRLNQRAAAEYLGISSQTWHRMKNAGELPSPFCIGSLEYYFEDQLDEWITKQNPHLFDDSGEFKGVINNA